jgi:hypothetical protein
MNGGREAVLPQGFGEGRAMLSPAYEHRWICFQAVSRKALGPGAFTHKELFPNFLVVNLEEVSAGSSGYCLRVLHHLVSDPKTQCSPLSRGWFAKDVSNIEVPSDELCHCHCIVPIYRHPVLAHFLANGCGTDRHGCFRDKLLEGFYFRQWNNAEWSPPHKITPDQRLVTGADEIDHLSH